MDERTQYTRICPLCGKEINYEVVYNDGTDWCGHHRGTASSETYGYECECDKVQFKRMCLNCCYYNDITNSCSNKKVIEDYKSKIENAESPFSVDKISINIKKPTNSCKKWDIDNNIASSIFK